MHLVFQQSAKQKLAQFFKENIDISGEIVHFEDDLSIGPLSNDLSTFFLDRKNWWNTILQYSPYIKNIEKLQEEALFLQIEQYLQASTENEICIWLVQNAQDITGYYLILQKFQKYISQISILFIHNLPFINEKGQLFYPNYLHEIPVEELKKTRRFVKKISPTDFEIDREVWAKITALNKTIRILETGKKLHSYQPDYLDNELLTILLPNPQKMNKIIQQYFQKYKNKISDIYIGWRLIELIQLNKIQGELADQKTWKEIELKLPEIN